MYKTIRHGENSLQYTILPQNDDFRIEGKLTSAESSCSSSNGRKSKTKRPRRRSFFAYLGLIFVCTVIVGAVLIPFLVSAECLPNPTDWFLGKKTEIHDKPSAASLKSHGTAGFINAAHSNFMGSGINVGKTVKIINQSGVEKLILRVNKTLINGTENAKTISDSNNQNISENQQNLNIVNQQNKFTAGNAITTITERNNIVTENTVEEAQNIKFNAQATQTEVQLQKQQQQNEAQNTLNAQLIQNNNGKFFENPPTEHFVTEVRFEPVESVSTKPLGIAPTIVVTTLRSQYNNNNNDMSLQQQQQQQYQQQIMQQQYAQQQPYLQQQQQQQQYMQQQQYPQQQQQFQQQIPQQLPQQQQQFQQLQQLQQFPQQQPSQFPQQQQQQQQQFIVQSQTAPIMRPTTTFSTSLQTGNNNSGLVTPMSTLLTRIIQVPLLKSAAKKPIIPPVLVKTNSQLSLSNGVETLTNVGSTPGATPGPSSLPQQPGVPSLINKNDTSVTNVEPAKATDWIHGHWPFVDPATYFQWTGYKAEDSVLLPALLGFALIGMILFITVCLVARNKRTIVSSVRKRNRNDVEENGAEDNTTLLTTANLSDED